VDGEWVRRNMTTRHQNVGIIRDARGMSRRESSIRAVNYVPRTQRHRDKT